MLLKLSPNMQFINADDGIVALDIEKNKVHYIENTGKDILDVVATTSDSVVVLQKFRAMHPTVNTDQIDADFFDFINELISKGILISYEV